MTPYDRWAKWREKGGKPPRPAGLPKRIPAAWWTRYRNEHPPKPPAPTPAPTPPRQPVEPIRVMFTAWEPRLAADTPAGWTIGLSADPEYRDEVLAAVGTAEAPGPLRGRDLAVWADCLTTLPGEAKTLAAQLGIALVIGQAEKPEEYDNSRAAGLTTIVGNASALTPAQLAEATRLATNGNLRWLQEAYWSDGYGPPSTVSANGIPAVGLVAGIYSACPHTLADYYRDLPSMATTCSVYLREGMA